METPGTSGCLNPEKDIQSVYEGRTGLYDQRKDE